VNSVSYSISKTSCSVRVSFTQRLSGTIRAVVQQRNPYGVWSNYLTICNESFSASFEIYRAISCNLPSGTYRIHVYVFANNTPFNGYSGSYNIS
jgi:hypothetical protein